MAKSVKDAVSRASSYLKAQKTKNLLNKNRERTSVVGTIVKIMERMESSSNESAMGAQVNLMIMRQLEEMKKCSARGGRRGSGARGNVRRRRRSDGLCRRR